MRINAGRFFTSCSNHAVDLLSFDTGIALIVCLFATCMYKNI